jgi:hypothetical protein
MAPNATRVSSSGEPLLGTDGITCTVTGSLSGTSPDDLIDCARVAGYTLGDGLVTATAGSLTGTLPLTVVQESAVTSITAGPSQTMTTDNGITIGTITLTAQTALGPAFGGYFSCILDGETGDCIYPSETASDVPGVAITLEGCAAGTHTLSCTLVNTSISVTTTVSL